MKNLVFSRRAQRDLIGIWEYIAQSDIKAADRLVAKIKKAATQLALVPGIGHTRPDVKNPLYRFRGVYPYLIAYHVRGNTLTIVRVIHGARDLTKIFKS